MIGQRREILLRDLDRVVDFLRTKPTSFSTSQLCTKLSLDADARGLSQHLGRHPEIVLVKDWRHGRGRARWGHASFFSATPRAA